MCACSWTVRKRERCGPTYPSLAQNWQVVARVLLGPGGPGPHPGGGRAENGKQPATQATTALRQPGTAYSQKAKWERSKHTTWKFFHLNGIKLNVLPGVLCTKLTQIYPDLHPFALHFSPPHFSGMPNTGRNLFMTLLYIAMHTNWFMSVWNVYPVI